MYKRITNCSIISLINCLEEICLDQADDGAVYAGLRQGLRS